MKPDINRKRSFVMTPGFRQFITCWRPILLHFCRCLTTCRVIFVSGSDFFLIYSTITSVIKELYKYLCFHFSQLKQPTKLTPHFKFATIPDSSTDINLRTNYPRMHKYMTKYNQSSVLKAKAALKNQ